MSDKKKEDLEVKSRDHLALKQTLSSSGWPQVRRILSEEFDTALNKLVDGSLLSPEHAEARGVINFIKRFTDALDGEMRFGENEHKKYVEKYLNPPKGQEPGSA